MAPKIKAFIFDMDGTITDNMLYHLDVWERIVSEMGGNLKGDLLKKELYGSNELIIKRIFGDNKFSKESTYEWGNIKKRYIDNYIKGK
jgi:beta-phosphoglucomutase-like phosphatase (HAD superfamily)